MNEETGLCSHGEYVAFFTAFISAWSYHIISIVLLSTAMVLYFLEERAFSFGLILAVLITESMAWWRKWQIQKRWGGESE